MNNCEMGRECNNVGGDEKNPLKNYLRTEKVKERLVGR
jgi:hypothetical protein